MASDDKALGRQSALAAIRETVEQDYIIEQLKQHFHCRVLWCEGRACIEYNSREELELMSDYVSAHFGKKLMDVFFTAVESVPLDD